MSTLSEKELGISTRGVHSTASRSSVTKLILLLLFILVCNSSLFQNASLWWKTPLQHLHTDDQGIQWIPCSETDSNIECTTIDVPLDYQLPPRDEGVVTIALARYKATNPPPRRRDVLFINPGGPGAAGTDMVHESGAMLSSMMLGKYEIIGFDPRGIGKSKPTLSCFPSEIEEIVANIEARRFRSFNLPSLALANITGPGDPIWKDLERQVKKMKGRLTSVAQGCFERTGKLVSYMGTKAVVHDLDFISKKVQGELAPINLWVFSYGTVIGQYLLALLPPERIGRVVLDGIVDVEQWSSHSIDSAMLGLDNINDVLQEFASTCVLAGQDVCALAHLGSAENILQALNELVDSLYFNPRPLLGAGYPSLVEAHHLRAFLYVTTYAIASWPEAAKLLNDAIMNSDFSGIVSAVRAPLGGRHGFSTLSSFPVLCADSKPYDPHSAPSVSEFTQMVMSNIMKDSPLVGDHFGPLAMCSPWDEQAGLDARKTYFEGPFGLPNGTLWIPALLLANAYDPSMPVTHARSAKERLGDNARLVEQPQGFGHCTLNHFSSCTLNVIQKYMVFFTVPFEEDVTLCAVDQAPFSTKDENREHGGLMADFNVPIIHPN
ncbi:hypothetical protein DL96DRAFT_1608022 [Flagelloscypha sp. PMI_526]|nr:hypothetical protein DL96DRAFT_1608022 [Flagelloscypha sp. PMI_526]